VATSGLDPGMHLRPFEVEAVGASSTICRVCELEGKRIVIASGDVQDDAFMELLLDLQALSLRYQAPGIEVLALSSHAREADTEFEEARQRHRLNLPLFRPLPTDENWREHYQVDEPLTLIFADAGGVVRYSAVAPEDLAELDRAIVASGIAVDILAEPAKPAP
jgi:hypothetical protein